MASLLNRSTPFLSQPDANSRSGYITIRSKEGITGSKKTSQSLTIHRLIFQTNHHKFIRIEPISINHVRKYRTSHSQYNVKPNIATGPSTLFGRKSLECPHRETLLRQMLVSAGTRGKREFSANHLHLIRTTSQRQSRTTLFFGLTLPLENPLINQSM